MDAPLKYSYRVTKYNPLYRDPRGFYLREEWTSVSDIGKTFCGKKLTPTEYLKVEGLYLAAITAFMDCLSINILYVDSLTKWKEEVNLRDLQSSNEALKQVYVDLKEGIDLNRDDISNASRLVLRDEIGLKLIYPEKMFVHFGYDYYMYIGCSDICSEAIINITKSGLFIENFVSPYLDDQ
jgi:hypothetical protein